MAYPTLTAAVGDVAHPAWRGAAVSVYRLGATRLRRRGRPRRRASPTPTAAAILAASGIDVAVRMRKTCHREPTGEPA